MERLKLIAMDEQDLSILSAHCQDAVLKTGDIRYFPDEKRFVLPMNRFVWERAVRMARDFERRRSILHFERVEKVRRRGLNPNNRDQVLALLAVTFEASDPPAGTIVLTFAGDAMIRLDVECIEAQLSDLAAAWQANFMPDHDRDDLSR